ncbi:MAG: enoyl-CoA hydratase [Halioglobus sp.]|nr:enoyl-CoA hydratase [Halioglobus sp.]
MNLGTDIDEILVSLEDGVLSITLNRPAKKNALHGTMYARMAELIEGAAESSEVGAILFAGTDDCFSSGNDVSTFGDYEGDPDDSPPVRFLRALVHCQLPVVAAVNGPAIGVGTTMLLHCDVVVAGDEATFNTPFVDLGVCPEAASSYTMPQRMGYTSAARLLLLGETFDAAQALDCGLVTEMHPAGEYRRRAGELAARLAGLPRTATRATKRLMRAPMLAAMDEAMRTENREFAACMTSPEFAEAVASFLESTKGG